MIISYLLVVGDIPFALSRSRPEVVRTLPTATRAWSIQCVIQSHCFQIGNLVSWNSCSIIFQGSLMIWLLMESAETSAKRIGAQKSEIHFETHRRWSWIHHINYFPMPTQSMPRPVAGLLEGHSTLSSPPRGGSGSCWAAMWVFRVH